MHCSLRLLKPNQSQKRTLRAMNRKLTAAAVVIIVVAACLNIAQAADFFSPYFQVKQVQLLPESPCGDHGGLAGPASLGHDDGSLLLAFTCRDDRVVLWRDMRPGSGNGAAVGATTTDIKLHLDAPGGVVGRGAVAAGGWAYECGHTISAIQVMVGNQSQDYGPFEFARGARPDVAAAYGNTCSQMGDSGVGFDVDFSGLAPGTYPVSMRVADDAGRTATSNILTVTVR
jgi:hypothetical protein